MFGNECSLLESDKIFEFTINRLDENSKIGRMVHYMFLNISLSTKMPLFVEFFHCKIHRLTALAKTVTSKRWQ